MKAQNSQNLQVDSANQRPNRATFVFPIRMTAGSQPKKSQCFKSEGRKKLSTKFTGHQIGGILSYSGKVQPFCFIQAAHKIIRVGEQFLNF